MSNLKRQGMRFHVRNNTLAAKHINYKNDFYEVTTEDIVPNGVAEIAHLEAQDCSYVKP